MSHVTCPYCGQAAELCTGREIYPHRPDLADLRFWRCVPCKAWTGCHLPNPRFGFIGTEPKGTLANEELRRLRITAHSRFDPLWKAVGLFKGRKKAYAWLAREMGLTPDECHIGHFNEDQCRQTITLCIRKMRDMDVEEARRRL